ncbi:MAG: (2Fe-2S) ferredoxin domain-containing protein [Xenococcus sp. MO_188.B8]|nr:(2Fe-2S) ferredoxin domain-containing protein [Xenococcus sp. MO_188.B8]
MGTMQPLVSEFTIVGKLEDIISKSNNCIKYLQLTTEEEEYSIKVAKELRSKLAKHLTSGCWLKVTGMRKYELHKGQVKYKAYRVELLAEKLSQHFASDTTDISKIAKPKAKVLFCQKSTCWKKGGKSACQLLKAELEKRGIADQVDIKTVGCLKQCKKAPNMVIMPDKAHYNNVKPNQVPSFIEKHLLVTK